MPIINRNSKPTSTTNQATATNQASTSSSTTHQSTSTNTNSPSTLTTPINNQPTTSSHSNTQTKTEPKTIPKHVKQALELKKEGLIRVSIHPSSAFTNSEMHQIMHNMGVARYNAEVSENLILAYVRTGSIQKKEIGIQANDKEMDKEMAQVNLAFARNITVPDMKENLSPFPVTIKKPDQIFFNTNAFKNYTNMDIPQSIAITLSFGAKFSTPVYYEEADFEKLKEASIAVNEAFSHPLDKVTINNNIEQHIKEYKTKQFVQHSSEIREYFTKSLKETKQFLKTNNNIVAASADKANVSILMDKTTYISKIDQLLADETTYTQLKQSSLPAYKIMNKKLLNRMLSMKWITQKQHDEAQRTEVHIANIYALIKTHKAGNPARPVVNTITAPGYLISKTVSNLLTEKSKTHIKSKYNVTNSKEAIDMIKQARIFPDMKIRSYDAKSMFTNISVKSAINAIIKKKDNLKLDDSTLNLIIDTIKFACVTNTEIMFNDQVFKQIKGLRMGSPLSPILADFVMEDVLDKVFTNIMKPQLFIKYVDDILTAVEDKEHEEIYKALNEVDEHLKFDHEVEDDNKQINYLDFTIINERFNLKTKWYQKHIASGRFISFLAHHPESVLWHTAVQFVIKMLHNSSPEFHEDILIKAKHLLKINSYPQEYANRVINTAKEKAINKPLTQSTQTNKKQHTEPASQPRPHTANDKTQWRWEPNNTQDDPIYVTSLPYIPHLTNKIQKEIEESSSQPRTTYRHDFNPKYIKVASQPQHKLSTEIFDKSKKITSGNKIPMIDIDSSDSD